MSSYPTTSETLPSCIHSTNIYGILLGPGVQVLPYAELNLAQILTVELSGRPGSGVPG